MTDATHRSTETLDPADWDEFRALAHRMVDDSLDFLASLRENAPWQPMPREVRSTARRNCCGVIGDGIHGKLPLV